MDFDNIKKMMDTDDTTSISIPRDGKEVKSSQLPINKVRKSMKNEIFMQLVIIVIFFAAPQILHFYELPRAAYYIFVFITSVMTLGYLLKMIGFLRKTKQLDGSSKNEVVSFIHELELTLEVYKTAIISGSLLLPIPGAALFMGLKSNGADTFTELFMLQWPTEKLLLYIMGYLVLAILIYFMTVSWSNKLYGKHISDLKKVLKEFEV
jgi:hypothetical protein